MNETLKNIKHRFRSLIRGDLSQQIAEGYKARSDASPVFIKLPMRWTHKDRNVEFNLHSWRFLNAYWETVFSNQDISCLDEMFELVLSWYEFVESNGRSRFIWYDMSTGIRASHLGLFTEVAKVFEINEKYVTLINNLAKIHKDKLAEQSFITDGNHAIHQINGLRHLCSAEGDPSLDDYCEKNIVSLIGRVFDKNYFCTENSPFYHKYNLSLVALVDAELYPNLKQWLSTILSRGKQITPWLTDLNGDFYQIGDTEGKGEPLYSKLCTDVVSLGQHSLAVKDIYSSGFCTLRTLPEVPKENSFSFVFHATNQSEIHAHVDHLSFILFHRGCEIFTDAGKYTFEFNEWKEYFLSDRAHNVIGLKGVQILPKDIKIGHASMNPVEVSDSKILLSGARRLSGLFNHSRQFEFSTITDFLIIDKLENFTECDYEFRLHLSHHVDARIEQNKCIISKDGAELALIEFDQLCIDAYLIKGQKEPEIQGWVSRSYHCLSEAYALVLTFPRDTSVITHRILLL